MATAQLDIAELTQTQNQKVVSINNALNALDNASNKVLSKTITGNTTLTNAEWRNNGLVILTGSSLASNPDITTPAFISRTITFVNLLGRSCRLQCGTDTNRITLSNNEGKTIGSNGTRLFDLSGTSSGGGSGSNENFGALYTANNTTHEAAWTGLPSTTRRIRVIFDQLAQPSGDTTRHFLIQIGDSGGYEVTGYTAGCLGYGDTTWSSETTGFCMERNFGHNGAVGEVILSRLTPTSNTWVCGGGAGAFFASNDIPVLILGRKTLSSTLDRIRVIMKNRGSGEDFATGYVSIAYE